MQSEIATLYKGGLTTAEIGKRLGISREKIRLRLHAEGVKVYPPGKRPSGGKWRDPNGYIKVHLPPGEDPLFDAMKDTSGRIREHRLVMARHLGRPLLRTESVHHKNGVRDDNRIENLELWSGPHPTGIVLQCVHCGSYAVEAV